jgi:hypothetical protein
MEQGERRGKVSIAQIERVIMSVSDTLHRHLETLTLLEEQARARAKRMLETLSE